MRKRKQTIRWKEGVKRGIALPVQIAVVVVAAIDILIRPVYRPIVTAISSLRLFAAFEAWINTLPRLQISALLAVPFIIAEPMKFGALFVLAMGHITVGVMLEILSHLITFVLVERIYSAGRDKLLTYRWLAWIMGYVSIAPTVFNIGPTFEHPSS